LCYLCLMQRKKPYIYGGEEFSSLAALRRRIQQEIGYKTRVIGREFQAPVLADVIQDRHPRLMLMGIPEAFRFQTNEEGEGRHWSDSLAALYDGRWHRFSYNTALRREPLGFDGELRMRFQDRWAVVHRPRLRGGALCECGELASDTHHVEPSHSDIISACTAAVGNEDRDEWWKAMCEERGGKRFSIPEGHHVTKMYDEMTRSARYEHLCKTCHRRRHTRTTNNGA